MAYAMDVCRANEVANLDTTSAPNSEEVMKILGKYVQKCRMHYAESGPTGMTISALAEKAQVSPKSIMRLQAGIGVNTDTLLRVLWALNIVPKEWQDLNNV